MNYLDIIACVIILDEIRILDLDIHPPAVRSADGTAEVLWHFFMFDYGTLMKKKSCNAPGKNAAKISYAKCGRHSKKKCQHILNITKLKSLFVCAYLRKYRSELENPFFVR